MLFFPRGLLPALGDATASLWSKVQNPRRPGASPPGPATATSCGRLLERRFRRP
jgi:hypothetical protein